MGCIVFKNQHGTLCYRLYWKGHDWKESSGLKDTAKNREIVEAWAAIIRKGIDDNNFDYLRFFPKGNHTHFFSAQTDRKSPTVREFYEVWDKELETSGIRPHTAQCYRSWVTNYILPALGNRTLNSIGTHDIQMLQNDLLRRNIGAPTINRALHHAFRAMVRSAIGRNHMVTNPFIRGLLKRVPETERGTPDPFTPKEREQIIRDLWDNDRFYFPLVYFQFWVGTRPSEALGLEWNNVDLDRLHGFIQRTISHGLEGTTKTFKSKREILIPREVAQVLKQQRAKTKRFVFESKRGKTIDEHNFYTRHWLPALKRCKVRQRPFYNTRHSYISFFLSLAEEKGGKSINFISKQCGVSADTIRRHYWRWIREKRELEIPKEKDIFTPPSPAKDRHPDRHPPRAGKRTEERYLHDSSVFPIGYKH